MRSIRWSRACVSTTIVTSSGISPSSTSTRMKSKSAFEADGKPTSISLNPTSHSSLNMRRLRSTSIGLMSAWLPSRRSTETQRGALVMRLSGQVRSGSSTPGYGRYLWCGIDMAYRPPEITEWTGRRPWRVATGTTDDYVHDCSPSRGGGGRQAGCAGSHRSSPTDHSERVRDACGNRSARSRAPVCCATCTRSPRPKGFSAARVLPAAVGSWGWRSNHIGPKGRV